MRRALHVRAPRSHRQRPEWPRALPARPSVGGDAAAVLARLQDAAATADELVRATGFDAGAVAAALTELELGGLCAGSEGRYRVL